MPKVSIIMPTHNCAHYICDALDSILAQSYNDYEVIVIDDGSRDTTKETLAKYGTKIRYMFQEHQGVAAARNLGIRAALGEYIAFIDADDIALPLRLQIQSTILDLHNNIDIVFSPVRFFDSVTKQDLTQWGGIAPAILNNRRSTFLYLFLNGYNIPTSSLMVRRLLFEKEGYFKPDLIIGEDYYFTLLVSRKYRFFCYQEPLALVRKNHRDHLTADWKRTNACEIALLKDFFNRYHTEFALTRNDLRRALSNCYLRASEKYRRGKEYGKSVGKLASAFIASPFNVRVYKTTLLKP